MENVLFFQAYVALTMLKEKKGVILNIDTNNFYACFLSQKKPYAEYKFTSTVSLEIKTKAPNYSEFCNAVDSNLNK